MKAYKGFNKDMTCRGFHYEEEKTNYNIKNYKIEVVDGEKIKEDTFYKLENGEFVEREG